MDAITLNVTTLASPRGQITAIRVKDVVRNLEWDWDINVGWSNQALPIVIQKNSEIYIAFAVKNLGDAGNLDIDVWNLVTQERLKQLITYAGAGETVGFEYTGNIGEVGIQYVLKVDP